MKFASLLFLLFLTACESDLIPYALEQGLKQGAIVLRSKKIEDVLKNPLVSEEKKHLLRLSQGIIEYARTELKMKVGRSYQSYVDLKRSYVTQVVMAAYKDRLESYFFKFPIVGAVPYKGYFDEKDAIKLQEKLKAENLDTYRREVDAFSSLGWFADPIVSSMLESEAQVTELLFHELTHLNFYFESESDFDEAFATYFSIKVAHRFMKERPQYFLDLPKALEDLEKSQRKDVLLGKKVREALKKGQDFYQKRPLPDRKEFFDWLKTHFSEEPELARLGKIEWNNAVLLSLSTYYELIPKIESYGVKHNLSESEYLLKIVSTGVHIVPEILANKNSEP